MIAGKICNAVRMDIEGVSKTGLPLEGFPQEFQTLVLDLVRENTFNLEFSVSCLLSALSTALGNSLWIHVKGDWNTNASMFLFLVGRAGLGKTPPMSFAFAPIEKLDKKMYGDFKTEMERYAALSKKEKGDPEQKPSICKTVLNDFTLEAMKKRHNDNLHGIAIKVDEIRGLFKKSKSKGDSLIETLLSAWSGVSLTNDLKTESFPCYIPHPCINLIGCVQTKLLSDTMTQEMIANGFFDRCLFCYPQNQRQEEWSISDGLEPMGAYPKTSNRDRWESMINKVLAITDYKIWKEDVFPAKVIEFSPEGCRIYFDWVNSYIRKNNAIEDDSMIPTRDSKLSTYCARLSLLMQVLRWACGESHIDYVDHVSVNMAIRLIEYYEECYSRMLDKTVKEEVPDGDAWLDELGDTFTAKELKQVGYAYGMQYRTIYDHVNKLLSLPNPPIRRVGKGKYEKVRTKLLSAQSAQCTTAQKEAEVGLSMASDNVCADSADVQCADEVFNPHNQEFINVNDPDNE